MRRRPAEGQPRLRARLAGFGLMADQAETAVGRLSGGQKARLSLLLATIDAPHLLILDEPTASLSSQESKRLYEILLGLKARGLAILYISHRTADLAAIADRVEVLRGGRNAGSFVRPVDFGQAIETMIGRSLGAARPERRTDFGKAVLELSNARILPDSIPFDLTLHAGEVIAITGVLGAGKSRLLSALFGAGQLASGDIRLDGRAYAPQNPADAIARGVALAAEDRHRSSLIPKDWPGESIEATISLPH
eukprot:gene59659-79588_t